MNAPAATAEHKVKAAYTLDGRRHPLYVVECVCGWSSALHPTQDGARLAWREHRGAE